MEPFPNSSPDELTQLRYLSQVYARAVPWGLDWPLSFWAERIGYDELDDLARLWLDAYHSRNTDNTRH